MNDGILNPHHLLQSKLQLIHRKLVACLSSAFWKGVPRVDLTTFPDVTTSPCSQFQMTCVNPSLFDFPDLNYHLYHSQETFRPAFSTHYTHFWYFTVTMENPGASHSSLISRTCLILTKWPKYLQSFTNSLKAHLQYRRRPWRSISHPMPYSYILSAGHQEALTRDF
jgi:hypothetical protein